MVGAGHRPLVASPGVQDALAGVLGPEVGVVLTWFHMAGVGAGVVTWRVRGPAAVPRLHPRVFGLC